MGKSHECLVCKQSFPIEELHEVQAIGVSSAADYLCQVHASETIECGNSQCKVSVQRKDMKLSAGTFICTGNHIPKTEQSGDASSDATVPTPPVPPEQSDDKT